MRPSRIIVGEVRQEESLDLLIALNSGLPGMCTLHAHSARETATKMCTLPLLAGENVGHAFVVPTVASVLDLVIHAANDGDGRRRIREIVAVPGWRAASWKPLMCSPPTAQTWFAPTAIRPTLSASSGRASTSPTCCDRRALDGIAARSLLFWHRSAVDLAVAGPVHAPNGSATLRR